MCRLPPRRAIAVSTSPADSLTLMRTTMSILLLVITACGGGGSDIASPCDLADAALVQSIFGGTIADGVEGVARNCEFTIEGGLVEAVNVYYFGSDEAG